MKNFKNVRAIKFTTYFSGNGCVNFDSGEQSYFLSKAKLYSGMIHKNVLFAKKIFKTDIGENGETTYKFKFKISSECLRHSIFEETIPFQNPNIMAIPHVLYNAIAMPDQIIRGYMFAQNTINSLRKRSALTICDAVEEGMWRDTTVFDFHSRSGEKDKTVKNDGDGGDTTIYSIENVGNLKYKADGFIDLTELQFISGDVIYDRMAVDADGGANEIIYLDALKRNFPSLNPHFDYYYMANAYSKDEWGERGILLDFESVNSMVISTLKNIMKININHRNANLIFDKLVIKVICDGNEESEEIEITPSNVDEFYFKYFTKYLPADAELIKNNKNIIAKAKEKAKDDKKSKDTKKSKETKPVVDNTDSNN